MKHQFDEMRATQAAARIFRLAGRPRLNYMVLIKFLYLVDREALLRWGRLVTYDDHFEMKLGPILSNIHDLITDPSAAEGRHFWRQFIVTDKYDVELLGDPGNDDLSEAEEELIDEVFRKYQHLKDDPFEFADALHRTLPELTGIQEGRAPLEITQILAAAKIPAGVISAIEDDLDAAGAVEIFLPRP
jgi:hypothetical protein